LKYHARRQQQELHLAFYLAGRLAFSGGHFYVPFHTLLVQSSLQTRESMKHGHDRTRSLQRVLEARERDGWIRRAAHEQVDTVLQAGLEAGNCSAESLAPATRERLAGRPRITGADAPFGERLAAVRLLLDENVNAYPVHFSSGPLLR
jgi:hypothetical protein